MKTSKSLAILAAMCCMPLLGACSGNTSSPPSSGGIAAAVDHSIASAMDAAQTRLQNEPLTISHDAPNLPVAKITPQGDLIVDGKTVAITPVQRDALLAYRKQMIAVATQGLAVGKQGAALGLHAASDAIAAVLAGKSGDEVQQKVEAQANGIRQAAAKICDELPSMMAAQQKLAGILPAFKPYATMTQSDIDDCRTDALHDGDDQAQVQQ